MESAGELTAALTEQAREQTRERLLEAAGEVFAEQGFRAATIREICQRGQANVAAVNYHFGDKRNLYFAAVERAHCTQGALVDVVWPPDWSPRQKLTEFIRRWLEHQLATDRPDWHTRLMMREMAEPTEACARLVEAYIRPMAQVLRGILQELVDPETADQRIWLIGFSIVSQCLFYKINRPIAEMLVGTEAYRQLDISLLADHIAHFSLAALGHAPPIVPPRVLQEPLP